MIKTFSTKSSGKREIIRTFTFILCLLPLINLIILLLFDGLGVNPIEFVIRDLGDWALRFIILVLFMGFLLNMPKFKILFTIRRMVGLFSFFYISLHLSSYVILDQFFNFVVIWEDILKRRYITLGFLSFVLLLPLALTSSDQSIKRLGYKTWKVLHRLIYPAAILAVIHYFMMIKANYTEPLIYAIILCFLILSRISKKFFYS